MTVCSEKRFKVGKPPPPLGPSGEFMGPQGHSTPMGKYPFAPRVPRATHVPQGLMGPLALIGIPMASPLWSPWS